MPIFLNVKLASSIKLGRGVGGEGNAESSNSGQTRHDADLEQPLLHSKTGNIQRHLLLTLPVLQG